MYLSLAIYFGCILLNGFRMKNLSKKYISLKPELEPGYKKLLKGLIVYEWIPFVIIALGTLSGMTEDLLDYFKPRSMNPIVLLLHFAVYVNLIANTIWIFFRNGAEFIAKHQGLIHVYRFGDVAKYDAKDYKSFFAFRSTLVVLVFVIMWLV